VRTRHGLGRLVEAKPWGGGLKKPPRRVLTWSGEGLGGRLDFVAWGMTISCGRFSRPPFNQRAAVARHRGASSTLAARLPSGRARAHVPKSPCAPRFAPEPQRLRSPSSSPGETPSNFRREALARSVSASPESGGALTGSVRAPPAVRTCSCSLCKSTTEVGWSTYRLCKSTSGRPDMLLQSV
jgi:hypothetical protein